MNKLLLSLLLLIFPVLAMADSSLSFTPPPSDFSVVFLGNLFGIVDGVLHGTGSQIMGSMFGVFNAAVLALGGIVIMYTLLVSTMNTAHEGQMLGQKWSSIWIPVRSVMGLALLMPKASGYCLMQIFVMWVVVQGVGAADKVWDAALNYLNRGGVIIQAQVDPSKALTQAPGGSEIATGAQAILAGQVCMIALQKQLELQLKNIQKQRSAGGGVCFGSAGAVSPVMDKFCNSSVPDFVNSVSPISYQSLKPDDPNYTLPMPNFSTGSPYQALNGICGTITWSAFPKASLDDVKSAIPSVSDNDIKTATLSRVIAIQQMYTDLATLAQVIVGNDPNFGNHPNNDSSTDFSSAAIQQFGVPHTAGGPICTDSTTLKCILWGNASDTESPPLLNGTEFQSALADYNGIMLPTLNLIHQAKQQSSAADSRKFIEDASTQGWIMAGSYFFDLVNLNVQANNAGDLIDSDTGLAKSSVNTTQLTNAFGSGANSVCSGTYANLCVWLGGQSDLISPIITLINGTGLPGVATPISPPDLAKSHKVIDGAGSSTVYGYTNNATVLQLPGQPGMQPLQFANMMNISIDTTTFQLPEANFPCGNLKVMFWSTCLGSMFGDVFYNFIIRNVYNFLLNVFQTMINQVLMLFLMIPLQGMASIFKAGLDIIDQPGVNPIVALANMGTYYINFTINLWMQLIEMSILSALIPGFGLFIFALIGMAMPLLIAWVGIMVSIGFTTAYYVPMLPYMIFTFGAIAWLMAVIEAMVAAPIVALGVTHPEGHDAFGKGEQAVMILMNVFLRPSMMIIGYIAAIALSYVGVWCINAGFDHAIGFVQGGASAGQSGQGPHNAAGDAGTLVGSFLTGTVSTQGGGDISGGYVGWAGIYAYFFSILMYTMLYLTVVTKAFTLIAVLPDKVLRWIGGQAESVGADTAQWGEEAKGKVGEAGKETLAGQKAMDKKLAGGAADQLGKAKDSGGGSMEASGGDSGGAGGGSAPPPPPP